MRTIWERYVEVFRELITDGWKVYRTKGSTVYSWVYPYTSLPTKFRMRRAYEISLIANSFNSCVSTTRAINYSFSLLYNTEECLTNRWV